MYATIRRCEGLNSPEQLTRSLQEQEFVATLKGIEGFIAYYLIDAGDRSVASVTVCQDHAGAEESNRVASRFVAERLSDLGLNPPTVTAGNVVLQG